MSAGPRPGRRSLRAHLAAVADEGVVGHGRRRPELDALRGLAILLVFAFHADGMLRVAQLGDGRAGSDVGLPLAFVRAGHTGVGLFFVLSGFLLAGPFLAELRGGRRVDLRRWAERRVRRIVPLYWLVVVGSAALAALGGRSLAPLPAIVPNLLFLSGVTECAAPLRPFSIPWWSLATEVQFYVLLPVLVLVLRAAGTVAGGAALFAVWAAAYGAIASGDVHLATFASQIHLLQSVLGRSPLFLAGMAAAALDVAVGERLQARLAADPRWARGLGDAVLWGCLLLLGGVLRWIVAIGPNRAEALVVWHVAEAACWAAVALVLVRVPLRWRAAYVTPVLRGVGVVSYSVFLLHLIVLSFVLPIARALLGLDGWSMLAAVVVLLALAATLRLSIASYRRVERPFLVGRT